MRHINLLINLHFDHVYCIKQQMRDIQFLYRERETAYE